MLGVVGTLNKLFLLFHPMPYLVTYGLVLILMSIILAMFGLMSIQITFLHRSVVHLQSMVKHLSETNADDVQSISARGAFEYLSDPDSYKPEYAELKADLVMKLLFAEMGKEPLWMPRIAGA